MLKLSVIISKSFSLNKLDREKKKKFFRQGQQRHRSNTDENDRSSISSGRTSMDINGTNDSPVQSRRGTIAAFPGGKIFSGIRNIFYPGMGNASTDHFNLPPKMCVSSSLPTREVTHWVNKRKINH